MFKQVCPTILLSLCAKLKMAALHFVLKELQCELISAPQHPEVHAQVTKAAEAPWLWCRKFTASTGNQTERLVAKEDISACVARLCSRVSTATARAFL